MAQSGFDLSASLETLSHALSLVQAFKAFDSDNDGSITLAELGGLMGSLGYNPSDQEVRAMMQRGDKNSDGLLSLYEFLDMNTDESQLRILAAQMRGVFEALDVKGDDVLTGEVLFESLNDVGVELTLQNCEHLIDSVDGDEGGAISFEDFKAIVNSILQ